MIGLVLGCLGPGFPAAKASVYVTGRVIDRANSTAVADAPITAAPALSTTTPARIGNSAAATSAQSLGNGSFILKLPAPGSYRLSVDAPRYFPMKQQITVPLSGLRSLVLSLDRRPSLDVKLPDSETGRPVDTLLWLLWGDREGSIQASDATVGDGGLVEIALPANADLKQFVRARIEIRDPGIGCGSVDLDHLPRDPVPISLRPAPDLSGRVVDDRGQPVGGAPIQIYRLLKDGWSLGSSGHTDATSGEDGRFKAPFLFPGTYLVRADFGAKGPHFRRVTVPQSPGDLIISPANPKWSQDWIYRPMGDRLPRGVLAEQLNPDLLRGWIPVSGRVVNRVTGAPAAGVPLLLYEQGRARPVDDIRTAQDGTYRLRVPTGGRYSLRADDSAYFPVNRDLTLASAATLPDLRVIPVPMMHVRVLTVAGKPAVGSQVTTSIAVMLSSEPLTRDQIDVQTVPQDGVLGIPEPRVDTLDGVDPPAVDGVALLLRDERQGCAILRMDHWPAAPETLVLRPGLTLAGTVRDPLTKAGVRVSISREPVYNTGWRNIVPPFYTQVTTDNRGQFQVSHLPTGTYQTYAPMDDGIHAALAVLDRVGTHVDITRSDPRWLYVQADKVGSGSVLIAGRVRDGTTGAPIPGVTVSLMMAGEAAPFYTMMTPAGGYYRMHAPHAGRYEIRIDRDRYKSLDRVVSAPTSGLKLDLLLTRLPVLHVRLQSPDGQIVTSASSEIKTIVSWKSGPAPGTGGYAEASPDTPGRAQEGIAVVVLPDDLPLLRVNAMLVIARDPAAGCGELHLNHWQDGIITVTLTPGDTLTGRVEDAAGHPVSNAPVRLARSLHCGGHRSWQEIVTTSDADGKYEFAHLLPGAYGLRVYLPGIGLRYRDVRVAAGLAPVILTPADSAHAPGDFPD